MLRYKKAGEKMIKEQIDGAIRLYFETLSKYGRSVSPEVNPMEQLIEKECQFLDYLDENDLNCWFCLEPMVVIQIDYKTQRPVWGCRRDRVTKGLQKIKWLDHCSDCGVLLNLEPQWLADQKEQLQNPNACYCCDKCIANGNILNDEDMKNVHKIGYLKA